MGQMRNAIITSIFLAREAVLSLRNNWGIGILSVVMAISLWVYVTDNDNPDLTGQVRGNIAVVAVNVPADRAVAAISPAGVTVRVRAPEGLLDDLTAADFRATVDLSGVATHEATVPVLITPEDPRVEVINVFPGQVSVELEDVTSRTVPVDTNLIGTPPRGYDLQGTSAQPDAVVITGPQRLIDQVDVVEADVNLTGARTNFQETLLVHARDGNGGDIEGVNIEPESVVVRAEILQVQFSAPVVVRPDISGTPAAGYNASSITVEPALVVLSGPAEAFSSIDAVQGVLTEPVSIEGASADVVRTVALRLPPGVTVDQPAVTVRVVIAPGRGSASFTVAVTPTNVPGGMAATLSLTTVDVVFVGTVPDLNAIDEASIVATVDLNGLEAGEHPVEVRVQAPPNVSVGSVQPSPITVTLRPS